MAVASTTPPSNMSSMLQGEFVDRKGVLRRSTFAHPRTINAAKKALNTKPIYPLSERIARWKGLKPDDRVTQKDSEDFVPTDSVFEHPGCASSFYGGPHLPRLPDATFARSYYALKDSSSGQNRTYYLLSTGCTAPPCALVLALHGGNDRLGGGEIMADKQVLWHEFFRRQAVLVFPDAAQQSSWWLSGIWQAEDVRSDGGFVWQLVREIAQHIWIDPNRIYLVGYSNGASLSLHAAACVGMFSVDGFCGQVAAVASVGGGLVQVPRCCKPSTAESKGVCDPVECSDGTSGWHKHWMLTDPTQCPIYWRQPSVRKGHTSVLVFQGLLDKHMPYRDPTDVDEWPFKLRQRLNQTLKYGKKNAVMGKSVRTLWGDGAGSRFAHYTVASAHEWYGLWGADVGFCATKLIADFCLLNGYVPINRGTPSITSNVESNMCVAEMRESVKERTAAERALSPG